MIFFNVLIHYIHHILNLIMSYLYAKKLYEEELYKKELYEKKNV